MRRCVATILVVAAAAAILTSACAASHESTSVIAVIGKDEGSHDGFDPGDSFIGGVVRLIAGDVVVLEESFDHAGIASITSEAGIYTLQVFLDSNEPGCFWGNTIYDVAFPRATVEIDAHLICSGG